MIFQTYARSWVELWIECELFAENFSMRRDCLWNKILFSFWEMSLWVKKFIIEAWEALKRRRRRKKIFFQKTDLFICSQECRMKQDLEKLFNEILFMKKILKLFNSFYSSFFFVKLILHFNREKMVSFNWIK